MTKRDCTSPKRAYTTNKEGIPWVEQSKPYEKYTHISKTIAALDLTNENKIDVPYLSLIERDLVGIKGLKNQNTWYQSEILDKMPKYN